MMAKPIKTLELRYRMIQFLIIIIIIPLSLPMSLRAPQPILSYPQNAMDANSIGRTG